MISRFSQVLSYRVRRELLISEIAGDLMSLNPEDKHPTREISQEPATPAQMEEKGIPTEDRVEEVKQPESNITYNEVDEEPSLHVRTYIALAAMFMLNLVQLVALQGPPTFVCQVYINASREKTSADLYC